MSITVLYYFQGEVGESLEFPNAFLIPNNVIQNKTKGLTFDIFCKYFPFYNKGNYHYRVQAEDLSCEYIWIDIISSDQVIPYYKNNIIFKILKLDEVHSLKRKSLLRRKFINQNEQVIGKQTSSTNSSFSPYNNNTNNNISNPNQSTEFKSTRSKESISTIEKPFLNKSSQPKDITPPPSITKSSSQSIQHNTENFFDFDDHISTTQITNNQSTPISPLNASSHLSSNTNTNTTSSFHQMDFNTSTIPSTTSKAAATATTVLSPQLDRAELKANLENKINDQVKKALDEKLEQDRKSTQAENDFDLAKQKHEQKLLAWSTNNKEKRNIRTLLSTMHNVLWSDSRWKTIGLGDLLEPKQVKLQYRKAMLVVHPDHCVNLTNENQFISKRIFEAVNEAYNEFLKKESV